MKGEVYGKRELSPLVGMSKKTGGGHNKDGRQGGGRPQQRRRK
jgi:small subunit ribosomal protein S3